MKTVFVFGSNEAGRHGAGAAKTAHMKYGAQYGKGFGHYGDSFAIPTKDFQLNSLSLENIELYIQGFKAYAINHHELSFKVTRIGCGLAGFADRVIAPFFVDAPDNCSFDDAWLNYLKPTQRFWGTF